MFELDLLFGIVGREVVEEDLGPGDLWVLIIDGVHFQEREIALAFLRRPYLSGNRIAGADVEPSYLGRGYVDIVWAGEVVVIWGSQKFPTSPMR